MWWRRWRRDRATLDALRDVELAVDVDGMPVLRGDLVTVGLAFHYSTHDRHLAGLSDGAMVEELSTVVAPGSTLRAALTRRSPGR